MHIIYRNNVTRDLCTNYKKAQKSLNIKTATKLLKLVNFIENAVNLKDLILLHNSNFHPLKGKRQGQFAVDIDGRRSSYRLIIIPLDQNEEPYDFNNISEIAETTNIIMIWEVSDHYEK